MHRKSKKEILKGALVDAHGDPYEAYKLVKDQIGDHGLIWSQNVNGKREPLRLQLQQEAAYKELKRLAKNYAKADGVVDTHGDGVDDGATGHDEAPDDKAEDVLDTARSDAQAAGENREDARAEAEAKRQAAEDAKAKLAETRDAVKDAEGDEGLDAAMDAMADARAEAAEAEAEAEAAAEAEIMAEDEAAAAEQALAEAEAEAEHEKAKEFPNEIQRFLNTVKRLRQFVTERDNFDPFDSYRIAIDGVKALLKGQAAVDGLLASLTATWPEDTREQAGIGGYDYTKFGDAPDGVHAAAPYVLALMKANIPVWLHGAAGTGKSTTARYAAEALGLDYYEVNLSGSLPSALKGRDRLKEFVPAEFCKAYEFGGIICLEEFGFAMPQTAAVINNAIANGHFHNDASGTVIERHPDFRCIVTDNGLGTGATRDFQRNRLDGATLDRFRMGRVMVGRDEALEAHILTAMLAEAGIEGVTV